MIKYRLCKYRLCYSPEPYSAPKKYEHCVHCQGTMSEKIIKHKKEFFKLPDIIQVCKTNKEFLEAIQFLGEKTA